MQDNITSVDLPSVISGIDTLYYFYETYNEPLKSN
jgi:hypothetical protein